MAVTFRQMQDALDDRIQDTAKRLSQDARDRGIKQAISMRYSKDRPRTVVSDVVGAGTMDIPLPQLSQTEVFDPAFGYIKAIEYPVDSVPPELLDDQDWILYEKPTGYVIRLASLTPAASDTLRVTWTTPHKEDASTIPFNDYGAVSDYAASLCFDKIAASYLQTVDPTLASDAVNYRSKSGEALQMAKAYRQKYFDHIGIAESGAGGNAANGPAIAIGEMDNVMGPGVDRLIHGKGTR
jgi:hypothetical protein